ncbi:uncharacterized protein TRAVEDRAFT_46878 [Trametes versicolor FP-101664 SS1]|uniref:uncharacterized protein n=1 Tax=Trametes versicolor (strain FP-101664) TaxID=717944 RepID=UPI0004623430|nr:uncharacterized protein TRAVEDRAFT_46878 [Trametes versicolor FP-101664 SS1]EIW59576.1 hypothetical protein TRAVEDRAFT_46878 [Trametes versicolor FP-101664 SS1]
MRCFRATEADLAPVHGGRTGHDTTRGDGTALNHVEDKYGRGRDAGVLTLPHPSSHPSYPYLLSVPAKGCTMFATSMQETSVSRRAQASNTPPNSETCIAGAGSSRRVISARPCPRYRLPRAAQTKHRSSWTCAPAAANPRCRWPRAMSSTRDRAANTSTSRGAEACPRIRVASTVCHTTTQSLEREGPSHPRPLPLGTIVSGCFIYECAQATHNDSPAALFAAATHPARHTKPDVGDLEPAIHHAVAGNTAVLATHEHTTVEEMGYAGTVWGARTVSRRGL